MKKKKELDSNPLNDLFHATMPERKERYAEEKEPELEPDMKELEDKKRARYEALRNKAKEY